jgi:hypothetical protein
MLGAALMDDDDLSPQQAVQLPEALKDAWFANQEVKRKARKRQEEERENAAAYHREQVKIVRDRMGLGEQTARRPNGADAEPAPRAIIRATPFAWIDPDPPRRWLYGRHYLRQFLSQTVAFGGVGKSNLAIVEHLSIVTGKPLVGVEPEERCNTWYWNGEDPKDELDRRIFAAALFYGIDRKELEGRFFLRRQTT